MTSSTSLPKSFSSYIPQSPCFTLFPYTTLFRSRVRGRSTGSRTSGTSRYPRRARPRSRTERSSTARSRSEEHTSELQSPYDLVCRLLLEKKKPADLSRRRVRHDRAAHDGTQHDE